MRSPPKYGAQAVRASERVIVNDNIINNIFSKEYFNKGYYDKNSKSMTMILSYSKYLAQNNNTNHSSPTLEHLGLIPGQKSHEKSIDYKFFISELNQNVLFRCPNIGSLLDEKIYYYTKYTEFKKLLEERKPITEEGYETLTIIDCERILEKFKKAIIAMNKGLQKQRFPGILLDELLEKERNSIKTRLNKQGVTDELIKNFIVENLYK
jgi:hypothetical protein